jgi:DNA polymerase III subunit delta
MASLYKTVLRDLEKKVYHPVYFLSGDEPFYIDKISAFIDNNVLTDTEKEFNQTVLYGKEVDLATVLSAAKRYPMMANYQVVIVKEAQEMKDLFPKGKSVSDANDKGGNKNLLLSYIKNPQKTTLLVFCYKYKKVDGRTKVGKTLMKDTVFMKSAKMYDDKIPDWIISFAAEKKYKVGNKAAQMLSDFLGNDLSKIANELDKLMINIASGEEITPALIEKFIGISKDYNIFELQDAIGKKDVLKANRIVKYFASNPKACPFPVVISLMYVYFNRLIIYHAVMRKSANISRSDLAGKMGINPFFLRDIEKSARVYSLTAAVKGVEQLHIYDLRSKGVGNTSTNHGELLKELIYKIMHLDTLEPA